MVMLAILCYGHIVEPFYIYFIGILLNPFMSITGISNPSKVSSRKFIQLSIGWGSKRTLEFS